MQILVSVIESKDKITMAEASSNQPKFVAPEGLSPEDKAHFEQYGRLPKPVKIKNHKVCPSNIDFTFAFPFSK